MAAAPIKAPLLMSVLRSWTVRPAGRWVVDKTALSQPSDFLGRQHDDLAWSDAARLRSHA